MKVAITGSSGFIGSELVKYLLNRDYKIILMQRKNPAQLSNNTEYVHFDLSNPIFPENTTPDVLIHCAVIAKSKKNPDAYIQNISSTLKIRDYCRRNHIHFIFLSTMSAHENAISEYGKHKFELEKYLDENKDTILKAGLVIGQSGGLFNNIRKTIEHTRIIPLVNGGNQPLQTLDVNELCALIEKVLKEKIKGKFTVASSQIVSLKQFYEMIAKAQGKEVKYISLPYGAVYFALYAAELVGIELAAGIENLKGLKQLKSFDTTNDMKKIGIMLSSPQVTIEKLFAGKK